MAAIRREAAILSRDIVKMAAAVFQGCVEAELRLRVDGSNYLLYMSVPNCVLNINKFYAHLMYFFLIYNYKYKTARFTCTTLYVQ